MSVSAPCSGNSDSSVQFEKELAHTVTGEFLSNFRTLVVFRKLMPWASEKQCLLEVKKFIELYAFAERQEVDVTDEKIQQLFDQAVANSIQQDCRWAAEVYPLTEENEEKKQKTIILLDKWQKTPTSMPSLIEWQQDISYLRNTLLPNAKTLLAQ